MPQNLKGHLALISLGLLAAASPFDGAAATQEGTSLVSPLARRLQLAPPQQLALDTLKLGTAPKIEKLDIPKQDLPKQPGPSSQTSKPPAKLDNADKASISSNANVVVFNDPKFGELKITPGAKAAYLQLPESVRAKLTDPQGGFASVGAASQAGPRGAKVFGKHVGEWPRGQGHRRNERGSGAPVGCSKLRQQREHLGD
jgi:hypothetical protein